MSGDAKIYVILGSHACRTGTLMLDHKGIPYRTVTLATGFHPLLVRLHGFSGSPRPIRSVDGRPDRTLARLDRLGTVPALRVNGTRVQTNRAISRYLDELRPEPPLFPSDPERRRAVEEAEYWGDEVLQMVARRLVLAAGPDVARRCRDGRLGTLLWRNDAIRSVGMVRVARVFRAGRRAEPQMLASLPGMLDRVDGWIEDETLNGEQLNAADFMIVTSLALLWYRPDVEPEIGRRPAGRLVDRVLPQPATSG